MSTKQVSTALNSSRRPLPFVILLTFYLQLQYRQSLMHTAWRTNTKLQSGQNPTDQSVGHDYNNYKVFLILQLKFTGKHFDPLLCFSYAGSNNCSDQSVQLYSPRCVSPFVDKTSKTPLSMVSRVTSKVPPPRSNTRMFFSPSFLSRP